MLSLFLITFLYYSRESIVGFAVVMICGRRPTIATIMDVLLLSFASSTKLCPYGIYPRPFGKPVRLRPTNSMSFSGFGTVVSAWTIPMQKKTLVGH